MDTSIWLTAEDRGRRERCHLHGLCKFRFTGDMTCHHVSNTIILLVHVERKTRTLQCRHVNLPSSSLHVLGAFPRMKCFRVGCKIHHHHYHYIWRESPVCALACLRILCHFVRSLEAACDLLTTPPPFIHLAFGTISHENT